MSIVRANVIHTYIHKVISHCTSLFIVEELVISGDLNICHNILLVKDA